MGVAGSHCPVLASLFRDLSRAHLLLSVLLLPFLSLFFPLFLPRPLSFPFYPFFQCSSFSRFLSASLFLLFCVSALFFHPLASVRRFFLRNLSPFLHQAGEDPLARGHSRVRWSSLFTAAVSTASSIVARTPALSRGGPHWRVDGGGRRIGSGGRGTRVAGRLQPARWGEAARRDERRVRERNKISEEEGG